MRTASVTKVRFPISNGIGDGLGIFFVEGEAGKSKKIFWGEGEHSNIFNTFITSERGMEFLADF